MTAKILTSSFVSAYKAKVNNPNVINWLLSHVLQVEDGIDFNLSPYEINEQQYQEFNNLFADYQAGKPLAYIIGNTPFGALKFKARENVLIPRESSYTLIDAVFKHGFDATDKLNILDLGVGSGCLLLSLLAHFKNANGYGVDICKDAIDLSSENISYIEQQTSVSIESRVSLRQADYSDDEFMANIPLNSFDIVIANPPYIAIDEKEDLAKSVLEYEPKQALFAKDDGLFMYKNIFTLLPKLLRSNKSICVIEHGFEQQEVLINMINDYGLNLLDCYQDIANAHNHPRAIKLGIF